MPVVHLLAGPNGSGKSTYAERVLQPVTHLPFVNADQIAAAEWPSAPAEHAYEASRLAAARRSELMNAQRSFITETVFSHSSKVDLVVEAVRRGYLVHLHVMMVPVEVSVARVAERVATGGHDVPEQKVRDRHARLWDLIERALPSADRAEFFDNSTAAAPFRLVATYEHGVPIGRVDWPSWAPSALTA
ncbi:zeta toxin family protein [Microbacterium sp. GCS4]|uniref:zeta toxin family protein n=1 Tax=Microbacterium sp. GCS4 TaxID=1692239 RepID=UPI00068097AD|nr:zeta toxin family protein [Microbacterium sp. GCS4]KNY06115.1 ATPase [Microbacterium sp. GCS4]